MKKRLWWATIGICAAVRTPFWLRGSRLKRLIDGQVPSVQHVEDPAAATKLAFLSLRVLGRVPLLPYRNTCLYRSIAECLVLSRLGIPCRLRIGVQPECSGHDVLEAHAWVERNGQPSTEATHVELR